MSRLRFKLDATETFVRWLESKCGPEVIEGIGAVIDAERADVGQRIERELIKARHYHSNRDAELADLDVLTANRVVSIVRQESGIDARVAR